MHVVPKAANDMMSVGRLQGFDGKITAQGKRFKWCMDDTTIVCICMVWSLLSLVRRVGKLLLQGSMSVGEFKDQQQLSASSVASLKARDRQVFLFEQMVILSEAIGARNQFSQPAYLYKNHLQVNKMTLTERSPDDDPLKFVIKAKSPQQTEPMCVVFVFANQAERDEWCASVKAVLDRQTDFLRALQSPIAYQKELTKEYVHFV